MADNRIKAAALAARQTLIARRANRYWIMRVDELIEQIDDWPPEVVNALIAGNDRQPRRTYYARIRDNLLQNGPRTMRQIICDTGVPPVGVKAVLLATHKEQFCKEGGRPANWRFIG
jgi:hypothetical protein